MHESTVNRMIVLSAVQPLSSDHPSKKDHRRVLSGFLVGNHSGNGSRGEEATENPMSDPLCRPLSKDP